MSMKNEHRLSVQMPHATHAYQHHAPHAHQYHAPHAHQCHATHAQPREGASRRLGLPTCFRAAGVRGRDEGTQGHTPPDTSHSHPTLIAHSHTSHSPTRTAHSHSYLTLILSPSLSLPLSLSLSLMLLQSDQPAPLALTPMAFVYLFVTPHGLRVSLCHPPWPFYTFLSPQNSLHVSFLAIFSLSRPHGFHLFVTLP